MITYCRLRPATAVTPAWAATCRREGTTTVECREATAFDAAAALQAGLLPVGGPSAAGVAAWVVDPEAAAALADAGAPGWRLTLTDEGGAGVVAGALRRSGAAFLRTGRSRVSGALAAAAGTGAVVSVFVDTVAQAVAAVAAGVGDLLLRDWDTERLGQLRGALGGHLLVERSALPVGLGYGEAAAVFDSATLRAWLNQVDAAGAARPRSAWAPGRDLPLPAPAGRLSAEWSDAAWAAGDGAGRVRPGLAAVLERSRAGRRPTTEEVALLLTARGAEVEAVAAAADELRRRANGDTVTFVVNRNINFTNRCLHRCGFCAFSRGVGDASEGAFAMPVDEVAREAAAAAAEGASEVCLQGGIHPAFTGDFYAGLVAAVRAAAPSLHIHAFSPQEVWHGARSQGVPVPEFLRRLRSAGLGSLPGTAAEILDDDVRRVLCPGKVTAAQWEEVIEAAHRLGIRSTATMMFGHVESPEAWARHLDAVRRLQERSGGFTEFVPLPFVHMGAPLYQRGRARPGPTWDEVVLVHAVARLALDGLIGNIQASWVKLGLDGAAALLAAGVNDLGGTLQEESISAAAGAAHGSVATPAALQGLIRRAGRVPARRTTLYGAMAPVTAPEPAR